MPNDNILYSTIICACWYIVICFAITRLKFFKDCGINKWWLIGLYSLKVLAGFAYGFFYMQPAYFATSDTWHYFDLSKTETDWLLRDPFAFFTDLFNHGYNSAGNLFIGSNSYWNDLKSNVIIKTIAISNVFTFKNYFGNIFIFNFLFLFGPVPLYKLLQQIMQVNKLLAIAVIFLIPSFLFWCSGIHKDGIIFTFTCLIAYHFYQQLSTGKLNIKSVAWMLVSFVIIFSLRNFLALLLLPSLLLWWLVYKMPGRALVFTTIIYILGLAAFFTSSAVSASLDMPQYVIEKQNEFKQLSGASSITVPPLENNMLSFIHFLPTAFDIGFLRPHIAEIKNFSYIPSVLEVFFLWAVIFFSILLSRKLSLTKQQKAFAFFALSFAISFLFLAGYTITFSGAIVRYRAVVLPFMIAAFLPWMDNALLGFRSVFNRKKK